MYKFGGNMNKNLFWKVSLPTLIILLPFIILGILQLFNKNLSEEVIVLIVNYLFEPISGDMLKFWGNFIGLLICTILACIILKSFRKRNKDRIFNEEDNYYEYSYFTYFYASKILNYGTMSLINIPIEMQYLLVLNRTFESYKVGNYTEIDADVVEERIFFHTDSKEVNFLLSDTYPLAKQKIPNDKQDLPTYIIQSRKMPDGLRIYNQKFVDQIIRVVYELSERYDRVNIFSYTNPRHNYEIINSCFRTGNRSGFSEVYVYKATGKPHYSFEHGIEI